MRWIGSLLTAFSMYSKLRVPQVEWSNQNMRYVMCCFPLVGAVVGGLVWLAGMGLADLPIGPQLRTVLLVLLPVVLTGGIHMDGFLDTMDALASYQPKERRLEILSDSHSGAFAVIGACGYFLLDYGIWSEMTPELLPLAALSFVFSRVCSGYAVTAWKSAKKKGLAAGFQQASDKKTTCRLLLIEGAAVLGTMCLLNWKAAVAAVGTALALYGYFRFLADQKFGGITGDLAGWFLQVCELGMAAGLVVSKYVFG